MNKEVNIAYIDGQNLYMGTQNDDNPWVVDLARFRIYLQKKYNVTEAHYYLGFAQGEYQDLYTQIQKAGFILRFKKHTNVMLGKKKGNVDTDIVFAIMKKLYKQEQFKKIVLVSGDGDYSMLVDFLIEENKFEKILFPCQKNASSLYKKITRHYFADLSNISLKNKIGSTETKEKGTLGS